VKLFLCRYKETAAVIAAAGVGDSRTVLVEQILSPTGQWSPGIDDRKQIGCRELKNTSHAAMADDAQPYVLARIG
jgi:hypothetical protein